ncbi:hypothetical protein AB1Y20_003315 [Prymnesium parvum]|uniref:Uncharacterized protein n=1 Tax=Prymnesium parvum TaxID=97485 RepID=A0AB34JCY2_PRYPA
MWEWTVVAAKEATAVDEQEVTEMVAKTGATDNVEAEEGVPEATVGEGERMAAEEREEELVVAVAGREVEAGARQAVRMAVVLEATVVETVTVEARARRRRMNSTR